MKRTSGTCTFFYRRKFALLSFLSYAVTKDRMTRLSHQGEPFRCDSASVSNQQAGRII